MSSRPGQSEHFSNLLLPNILLTMLPHRAYYSRGAIESLGASSTTPSRTSSVIRHSLSPATDHFPLSIFRPRTPKTPGGGRPLPPRPDSLVIEPVMEEGFDEDEEELPVPRRPLHTYSRRAQWSPHLHPDRRSVNPRRSTWRAPSLDEEAEETFSRRNVQVGLFAVGFVFPLGGCPFFSKLSQPYHPS